MEMEINAKDKFNGVPVCDVIKNARASAGFTQNEIAYYFGYSRRSVASRESGEREPSVAVFLAIMEYCGVPDIYSAFGYAKMRDVSSDAIMFTKKLNQLDTESKTFVLSVLKREVARALVSERLAQENSGSPGVSKMKLT